MKVSLAWLNQYLRPEVSADEAQTLLTAQGTPIETRTDIPNSGGSGGDGGDGGDGGSGGDVMLDVEVTSNRPDCLSHLGVAREIAAGSGRTLVPPCVPDAVGRPGDPALTALTSVQNTRTDLCLVYTARVIRGVKVGSSPAWMVRRLEAVGLRSVNNVVDVTNFVLMELGQPLHAFDMARLAERRIVVRTAAEGEAFTAIDGTKHLLGASMLVIADAVRPVAVAGVMGGLESEVGLGAVDILLESARFDPLSIRRTSRALDLASDSSYRFERGVDPEGVELASRRAAALIVEVAGGMLVPGVIRVGSSAPAPAQVTLRLQRCHDLLGYTLLPERIIELLGRLGLAPRLTPDGTGVACTVPTFRLDLQREVDLIEEVARLHGYDHIGVKEKLSIVAKPTPPAIQARKRMVSVLVAEGFVETINFSFLAPDRAARFLDPGEEPVQVDSKRRKLDPTLRPSLLPSLMLTRKTNQDAGNANLRLFEIGSIWSRSDGSMVERRNLGLLMDVPRLPGKAKPFDYQSGAAAMLGVLRELIQKVGGAVEVSTRPGDRAGYMLAARVLVNDHDVGFLGLVSPDQHAFFKLREHVVAAELDFDALISLYPPKPALRELARTPGIERELSIVVSQDVTWERVHREITRAWPAQLDELEHIGTYAGQPIPAGKKSLSLRLVFRDPVTTLHHDQVEPQVAAVVAALKSTVGADLRGP